MRVEFVRMSWRRGKLKAIPIREDRERKMTLKMDTHTQNERKRNQKRVLSEREKDYKRYLAAVIEVVDLDENGHSG